MSLRRGQTASIWCVRMQMDVRARRWRPETTRSSSSSSSSWSSSPVTLAMSRVPSPPPPAEMSSGPVAESWCYTQVIYLPDRSFTRRHLRVSNLMLIFVYRLKWWSSLTCGPLTTSAFVVRRWGRSSRAPRSPQGPTTNWNGAFLKSIQDGSRAKWEAKCLQLNPLTTQMTVYRNS